VNDIIEEKNQGRGKTQIIQDMNSAKYIRIQQNEENTTQSIENCNKLKD